MISKLRIYVITARPKTLSAGLGPVLLGLALASSQTRTGNWLIAISVILCVVSLQIAANFSNDYFDHLNNIDGSDRLGPNRAAANSSLLPRQVQLGYRVGFSFSLLLGLYLVTVGGLPIVLIGLAALFFAYFYTGGAYPLSYFGLGEILALIFFGPVAVWGTWFLMTSKFELLPAIVGLGPGFIAWSLMAINNMRDRKSDKKAGKKTLAVFFGEKTARVITIFGIIISVCIPVYLSCRYNNRLLLLSSLVFILYLNDWKRILSGPINKTQNKSLNAVSSYLFLYCIVLSITLLA